MNSRRSYARLCVGCALVLGGMAAGGKAGLRINLTPSMPIGLWHVHAAARGIARGEIVTVCPPAAGAILEGVERGYIGRGACPDGMEPLVKPVAAVPGDLVTAAPEGVAVNGQSIPGTAQLDRDSAGRQLQPIPRGSYRVGPGQLWLLSGHDRRSFDSRYFGAVPAAAVQAVARPVLVLP